MPRISNRSTDDYTADASRAILIPPTGPTVETTAPPFRQGGYSLGYHPTRLQSLSLGSTHYERTPFTANGHGGHYPDYMRMTELGGVSLNGENRQRKRRGNLPKETTDKLRFWFVNHLTHPYPTEDEKQELMRDTGLQMNQISNWFINARRRQLPTMMNNARVESDVISGGRAADGKVLPSTERSEFENTKGESGNLSDGEGSPFDEDFEGFKHRGSASMQRDSV